jgi:ElaB/YqjD/DUF883 family membrane-anchored ribosome-binding protein
MATTEDMAPSRSTATRANGTRSAAARAPRRTRKTRDDALEAQVARLQSDLKSIAATLAGMADSKVNEAKGAAEGQVQNLVKQGQKAVDNIQDEFGHMEKQIKDTIREKPLTAVAGAVAIGFVLALITR